MALSNKCCLPKQNLTLSKVRLNSRIVVYVSNFDWSHERGVLLYKQVKKGVGRAEIQEPIYIRRKRDGGKVMAK